jgi:hypothetical protein
MALEGVLSPSKSSQQLEPVVLQRPVSLQPSGSMHTVNGNFRILKWRYYTIGTSNKWVPEMAITAMKLGVQQLFWLSRDTIQNHARDICIYIYIK